MIPKDRRSNSKTKPDGHDDDHCNDHHDAAGIRARPGKEKIDQVGGSDRQQEIGQAEKIRSEVDRGEQFQGGADFQEIRGFPRRDLEFLPAIPNRPDLEFQSVVGFCDQKPVFDRNARINLYIGQETASPAHHGCVHHPVSYRGPRRSLLLRYGLPALNPPDKEDFPGFGSPVEEFQGPARPQRRLGGFRGENPDKQYRGKEQEECDSDPFKRPDTLRPFPIRPPAQRYSRMHQMAPTPSFPSIFFPSARFHIGPRRRGGRGSLSIKGRPPSCRFRTSLLCAGHVDRLQGMPREHARPPEVLPTSGEAVNHGHAGTA